jgi:hypothetical protein
MGLFACQPAPGTHPISDNILIGYLNAGVMVLFLLLSLRLFFIGRPGRWGFPTVLFVLLAIHPAWTISAYIGDCGMLKREASCVFTGIGGLLLSWQARRLYRRRGDAVEVNDRSSFQLLKSK